MEYVNGALVGTTDEFQRIARIASEDRHGNMLDLTAAIVVTTNGWGMATVDNRIKEISGIDGFRDCLEDLIVKVKKKLVCNIEPRVVITNGED